MQSCHALMQTSFWAPKVRPLGNVSIYATTEIATNDEAEAFVRDSPMDQADASLAGGWMRKFVIGTDPVRIDLVLGAASEVGITNQAIEEARRLWREVCEKTIRYGVEDEKIVVIGIEFPDHWRRRPVPAPDGKRTWKELTLRDFAENFFYDDFLHSQDGSRDHLDNNRKLVRTLPDSWKRLQMHALLSAAIFILILMHRGISEAWGECAALDQKSPTLPCPDPCNEASIIETLHAPDLAIDQGRPRSAFGPLVG